MSTAKRLITAASSILLWTGIVCAQEQNPANSFRSTMPVTAAATADRVRFTAPGSVVQMRLEVYGANGEKLFDNEIRGGNVLDWHLLNGQAESLADGAYLCVVTSKSLSGRITQRIVSATIEKSAATLQTAVASQLTPQQAQAVGPIEGDASLTLLKEDEHQTTTVIAHNGQDGQITRGQGALSFRLGDFFRGKDIEQMRLTPQGNLGIGITHPQARLDVDGLIRASEGIVFPDGSVQYSAARKTFGAGSLRPGQSLHAQGQDAGPLSPDTSGTGTTGRIAKWQDGPAGVLNDSNITEVSGAIGINGAPNPSFRLDVNGSTRIRGSNPGFNLEGLSAGGNIWAFQTVDNDGRFRLFGQDNVNPGVERLTISLSSGNVGIGATAPAAKLDVAGTINTSTQYNIFGQRLLGVGGPDSTFVGLNAGALNAGDDNSFFGFDAGASNTASFNSFFGSLAASQNNSGSGNVVIGAFGGSSNTTEHNNTFIGTLSNGAAGITNATALGYQAQVTRSNSLVLGSINTVNFATADTNVGIGTSAPVGRLQVVTANETNPSTITAWDSRHFVSGGTASSGGVGMSYDQTNNVGYFEALHPNVAWGNLILQSGGGKVGIGTGTTTPGAKLQVAGGSVYIANPGSLVITSPNGTCWFIKVSDAGVLSTMSIPCP